MHPTCVRPGIALALALFFLPTGALADTAPTKIESIEDKQGIPLKKAQIGGEIQVCLDGNEVIDPNKWQLFLDGHAVTDDKSVWQADKARCIIFALKRSEATSAAWSSLLGSPDASSRRVAISVAKKDSSADRLFDAAQKQIDLDLSRGSGLWIGLVVLALLFLGLYAFLVRTQYAIMRDRLLAVVASQNQPFSLGRLQMTIWFVLIAAAFIFLLFYIDDYNTVTVQALKLMGISAATGLGAIAANGTNNDDLKAANAQLAKVGWRTPADVPPEEPLEADVDKLSAWKCVEAYKTQGAYRDLFYDENGAALHRLQVFFWTIVLGIVFVFGVWQRLAMPEFSDTLLALMAVSGASYVGFKFAEKA